MVFKIPGHFQAAGGNEQKCVSLGWGLWSEVNFGNFTTYINFKECLDP